MIRTTFDPDLTTLALPRRKRRGFRGRLVSITTPPSYGYREVGYGRNAPYPSNARAKLLIGLPHDTVTEYVTETPEQIRALLEAQQ